MRDNSKPRVYVCGKMTGVPYYNFPAFDKAKAFLEGEGFEAVSPADIDRAHGFDALKLPADHDWNSVPEGLDYEEIMRRDLVALDACDGVYCLSDGIKTSAGATCEIYRANQLGIPITEDNSPTFGYWVSAVKDRHERRVSIPNVHPVSSVSQETTSEPRYTERGGVLDEAKALICGDRNTSYGPPSQDFQRTADMMTALFGHKLKEGQRFRAADVAWVMMFVKASRAQHSPKRDNYVDAAGYAACGWECEAEDAKRVEASP